MCRVSSQRQNLKIKTRGLKKKPFNKGGYHYWLVQDKPTSRRRLPQLNKANHLRKVRWPKSELLVAALKAESEPSPAPKKGRK
jgi:hypothetical protein